jgi:CubicO group peptidase (beta-lactamase class C family)
MILAIILILSLQQFYNERVLADIVDISADLTLIREYYNMPGLSALALKKGKIVAQGASGYRRQGDPTPLLVTDPINLGSCSKWMTATVAGRLIDQKLLSWTTQVHECFSNYDRFNSAFQNATLEEFLAHRSGVQQSTTFYTRHLQALLAQKGTFRQIRHWVVETVLKDEPEVQPGEFLYANQGYAVAAAMLEQITGRDWESLIQEYVFTPLEMTSATIGIVYDDTIPPKRPNGHDLPLNATVPIPRPVLSADLLHNDQAATGPAGYIACTLQDWAKFLHAHVTAESTGYLSAETAAKLKRPFIGVEGYGLGVAAYNRTWATPGQALVHSGDIFGQDTVFWMTPSRDLVTAAYTNCRSDDTSTGLALDNAAGMLIARYANNNATGTRIAVHEPVVLDHLSIFPRGA